MTRIMNRQFYVARAICCSIFFLLFHHAGAQRPFIQTTADRTGILIGEQIRLTVTASASASDGAIRWFWIPDSIRHFEMVERGRIDTVRRGINTLFQQTLVITSFDSGHWYIPAFPVDIVSPQGIKRLYSDSIPVNVGYSPADSSGQLRDIKPVMEVTVIENYWYYIVAAIILLLIGGFLLYRYLKKRKARPQPVFRSNLPAYEEAMKYLQELQGYDLSDLARVREYHSLLAGIFKRYYSRTEKKDLMNKTTGDILLRLREHHADPVLVSKLADALRTTDAVKFAKYFPSVNDSRMTLEKVSEVITAVKNKLQATTHK